MTRIWDLVKSDAYTKYNADRENAGDKGLSMQEFFDKRIKIKNLHSEIVSLSAKKIQLHHQQRIEQAIKEGKKNRFLLLKYRRGGFTTWEQAKSYRMVTTVPNTSCVTLADTKDNTKVIFRMVKLMADRDLKRPPLMQHSMSHIEFPGLNSTFTIGTAGAKAYGRGDNIARVHGSEVSRWPGAYDVIEDLVIGLTEAAMYGQVVLETTASGADGYFYEMYKESVAGRNDWVNLFYPWYMDSNNVILDYTQKDQEELFDTLDKEERSLMESEDLTVGQMLWRRDKKHELKDKFKQEYPETWHEAFIVKGHSFFDQAMLEEVGKYLKKPLNNRKNIVIWEKPKPGVEYCAGADTAEGNENSDDSVMGILNKKTGEQVCVLRGKWRPEIFARKCIALCRYYNDAMFACEVNNHGHSVMNTVMNTLKYKYLYHRVRPIDKNKYGQDKKEHVPGWHTNAQTRPILLDDLNEAIEEGYMGVNDPVMLAEAKTFVDNGGRYEADKKKHDDSIIAWGISWQCRNQRKKSTGLSI